MDRIVATKVCVCFSEIRFNLGKRIEVERLNEWNSLFIKNVCEEANTWACWFEDKLYTDFKFVRDIDSFISCFLHNVWIAFYTLFIMFM